MINSFSAVVSSAELIRIHLKSQEPIDEAEIMNLVESIVRNSLDASTVTRRLIDFSHQSTDPAVDQDAVIRVPVDLNALIMDVIELEGAEGLGEIAWRLASIPFLQSSGMSTSSAWRSGSCSGMLRRLYRMVQGSSRFALIWISRTGSSSTFEIPDRE